MTLHNSLPNSALLAGSKQNNLKTDVAAAITSSLISSITSSGSE